MSTPQRTTPTAFDPTELRSRIAGAVLTPTDEGWDDARLAWNLSVDQHPAAVALPESAEDVVEIVLAARAAGLAVAPQGTGHGAAALRDRLGDAILVKTERMRGVRIDPAARTARVSAGDLWADVTAAAARHGLAALAGSAPDVGVVGYTLGGGLSFISRRHGLAANAVTAVELVTGEGRLVRTDATTDPDLFWALRGGGGNFGVVTAIEFGLFPVTELYAGALFFPVERAGEVLGAWREWAGAVGEETTSVGRIMHFPPIPEMPEHVRGRSFALVEVFHLGDEASGAALVAPLRALGPVMDTVAVTPASALAPIHMDPPQPAPGVGDGAVLADVTPATIDAVVAVAGAGSGTSLLSLEVRHIGGAAGRPAPGAGALSHLDGEFIMFAVGIAPTPEAQAAVAADVVRVRSALRPWEARQTYLNFTEGAEDSRRFYPDELAARRIEAVRLAVDPAGTFLANHPIAAAR